MVNIYFLDKILLINKTVFMILIVLKDKNDIFKIKNKNIAIMISKMKI